MPRSYEEEVRRVRLIGAGLALGGGLVFALVSALDPWPVVAVTAAVAVLGYATERALSTSTFPSQGVAFAGVLAAAGPIFDNGLSQANLALLAVVIGLLQILAGPLLASVQTIGR